MRVHFRPAHDLRCGRLYHRPRPLAVGAPPWALPATSLHVVAVGGELRAAAVLDWLPRLRVHHRLDPHVAQRLGGAKLHLQRGWW